MASNNHYIPTRTPTTCLAPPSTKPTLFPILDSGAEISCFPTTANNHTNPTGTRITQPNGAQATSVGTTACRVGPISFDANMFRKGDITQPLLAAHDITASGATIVLNQNGACIYDSQGTKVLHAPKHHHEKLWRIPIHTTPENTAIHINNITSNTRHAEQVAFASAALGSPTDRTLYNAVKQGWIQMGISGKMILQNPPRTIATSQGHIKLIRQGKNSTKPKRPAPPAETPANKVLAYSTNGFSASDIAGGPLPVASISGNRYLLITVYKNYIHFHPLTSMDSAALQHGLEESLKYFEKHGHKSTEHRMDNQTSNNIHDSLTTRLTVQYYPPGNHRANPAERAIQTSKAHIISILNTCHPEFPNVLWDKLLNFAETTINLLRPYGPDPQISAYEGIHGPYDFNAHPLLPIGSKCLVYQPRKTLTAWQNRGLLGYYLGPSLKHYRCHLVYIIDTAAIRTVETLTIFPDKVRLPGSSRADVFMKDLKSLAKDYFTSTNNKEKQREIMNTMKDLMKTINNNPHSAETILEQDLHNPYIDPTPTENTSDLDQTDPHTMAAPSETAHASDQTIPNISPAPSPQAPTATPVLPQRVTRSGNAQAQRVTRSTNAQTQRVTATSTTHRYSPYNTDLLKKDLAKAAKALIGKSFTDADDGHTYQIKAIAAKEGDKSSPPLPYFTYYDIHAYPHGPPDPDNMEYQPIREFLVKKRNATTYTLRPPTKQQTYNFVNSIYHSHIGQQPLNIDPTTGTTLTYRKAIGGPQRDRWIIANGEELERLMTSATIRPIHRHQQPPDRRKDTTYNSPKPKEKLDDEGNKTYRMRFTLGGDRLKDCGPTLSHVADHTTINIHQQSVLKDLKDGLPARYVTADCSNYYLQGKLDRPEYVLIPITDLPATVIDQCGLRPYIHNNKILFEVNGSMYGHPAAGRIAQHEFITLMNKHGYYEDPNVPCLFKHITRPTTFTLVVDDLGIKILNETDLQHLIATIQEKWEVKVDRSGTKYNGLRLTWNYKEHTLMTDIPNYVTEQLTKLGLTNIKERHTPAAYQPPPYGKEQWTPDPLASIPATPEEKKIIEQIQGIFLYYGRKADPIMRSALLDIQCEMANATKSTYAKAMHLAGFAKKYPNAQLMYKACDMILRIQSDASHHRLPNSRSVAGGIQYLTNIDTPHTDINGPIDIICKQIQDSVCASAMESEYAALFINGQQGCFPLTVLRALGYPQHGPTTILCDNTAAQGVAHRQVTLRRSKAVHTRYNWIRDRCDSGQYKIIHHKGATLDADCFTKHHPRLKIRHFMTRFQHEPFQTNKI